MISTRQTEANYPKITAFDAGQPNSYIIYLEADNL